MPQNDAISESEEEVILGEDAEPPPPSAPIPGTSKQARPMSNSAINKKKGKFDSEKKSKRSQTTSKSMKLLWAKRRANKPQ